MADGDTILMSLNTFLATRKHFIMTRSTEGSLTGTSFPLHTGKGGSQDSWSATRDLARGHSISWATLRSPSHPPSTRRRGDGPRPSGRSDDLQPGPGLHTVSQSRWGKAAPALAPRGGGSAHPAAATTHPLAGETAPEQEQGPRSYTPFTMSTTTTAYV